jgi:hypothetical protein
MFTIILVLDLQELQNDSLKQRTKLLKVSCSGALKACTSKTLLIEINATQKLWLLVIFRVIGMLMVESAGEFRRYFICNTFIQGYKWKDIPVKLFEKIVVWILGNGKDEFT